MNSTINRREFAAIQSLAGIGWLTGIQPAAFEIQQSLKPTSLLNQLRVDDAEPLLKDASWYIAEAVGDGLYYRFEPGLLSQMNYLTADILVDGNHLVVFHLLLQEGENGPVFRLSYKGLNQAQARIRFPLQYVDQRQWRLEREGAWLKPTCGGDRVDLSLVDRITIKVANKSDRPARWLQTPVYLTVEKPPLLQNPLLPKGKLLDELGQSTIHDWPEKSRNVDEVVQRFNTQLKESPNYTWPGHFSKWGGWNEKKIKGSGFFSTHYDGRRWWLVDPDGHFYWSAGLDCVRPYISADIRGLESALTWVPGPSFDGDYLKVNLTRAFGDEWYKQWATVVLALLKEFGFNTVANWSNWDIARDARFPYVRPLSARFPRTPNVYRDFPDVYHENFQRDADAFAGQLRETANDPALLGYFLMNEPTWGFSSESPAAGMLFNTPECFSRIELARFLERRYGTDTALSKSWGIETTVGEIRRGPWKKRLTNTAKRDLFDFSEKMVTKFFQTISEACKRVDPHHLNLGIRYQGIPPKWCVPGMKYFDVFSMNCYQKKIPYQTCKEIHDMLHMPILIGEYHFGALDVGLPSPGLVHVRNQRDRGRAYRYYFEDAAANPFCVGVHYFTLYDQSAIGRFDGENYNIGFLDICHKPYLDLVEAAKTSHLYMYEIAEGSMEQFNDPPEYLPRLF